SPKTTRRDHLYPLIDAIFVGVCSAADSLAHAGVSAELDMVSLGWRGVRSACAQHVAAAPRIHSPAGISFPAQTGQHRRRVSDGGGGVIPATASIPV